MDVFEAIQRRCSVKPESMQPGVIAEETLRRLLEAAHRAPSHGRTDPWRFHLFSGAARDLVRAALCETMRADAGAEQLDKIRRKAEHAAAIMGIVCVPSGRSNIPIHEEIAATAMAVQNLHLAATAEGLVAFWSSGAKVEHPAIRTLLGLNETERCLGLLYLGHPAGPAWPPPSPRSPIADHVRVHGDGPALYP